MLALSLLLFCGLGQWQSALCGAVLVLALRGVRKVKIV
jgi:hypothetical protein